VNIPASAGIFLFLFKHVRKRLKAARQTIILWLFDGNGHIDVLRAMLGFIFALRGIK
jgi:hypothetical protein